MAEKELFTIPNQVAQMVTEKIPWEFSPDVPEQVARTKREYQAWRSQPSTQHCMYSCMEGAVKGMRISVDNPIIKIHGIIADYDTVISDELVNASIVNCKGEFRPNWVHHTPHSGGRRLIWLFETPALVAGNDMARLFCVHAAKSLKPRTISPALTEKPWATRQSITMSGHNGGSWTPPRFPRTLCLHGSLTLVPKPTVPRFLGLSFL